MYLWNTNALATELKERTVSEGEKFKYYITTTLLYEIHIFLGSFSARTFSAIELFLFLLGLILIFFGTYWCYRINRIGDGINFIERFICLSLPIGIKITVWSIVGMVIIAMIMLALGRKSSDLADYESFWGQFTLVVAVFIYVLFYWRIYIHIKWISHK